MPPTVFVQLGLTPVMHPDTAGAAKDVAAAGDPKMWQPYRIAFGF